MAKGHLSEDTINFIVTAESDQLQQEIHKSGKALGNLNAMTYLSPVMAALTIMPRRRITMMHKFSTIK